MQRRVRHIRLGVIALAAIAAGAFNSARFVSAAAQPEDATSRAVSDQPTPTSAPAPVDEELVKKLLGGESTAVDTVDSMVQDMQRAAERLTSAGDVGPGTQQIQARIVAQLDDLIQQASRGSGNSKQKQKSRQKSRRPSQPKEQQGPPKSGEGAVSQTAASGVQTGAGPESPEGSKSGGRADLSRRWGFLPEQERAEIAQGLDEKYLPRFREHIRRYYLRLAEQGTTGDAE